TAMPANGKSVAICPARPVFGYSEPALQRRAGGLQPGQGLAFELRRQHLANPGMIGVPPGDLRLRQQAALNQCRIDRREGERFEAEPFAFAALDPARLDEDEVLDPDAVLAGLIVTGLVGEDHAGDQLLLRPGLAPAGLGDALRSFVHGEEAADAVSGSVL